MESETSREGLWIIKMVGLVTFPKLKGILSIGDPKPQNTVGDLVQLFRDAHYLALG